MRWYHGNIIFRPYKHIKYMFIRMKDFFIYEAEENNGGDFNFVMEKF